ncbi:MAG: hypothetical protein H0V25_10585 [Solirubrobacterales bacterium]|nr:hypothetical protein [Solirubrobacterales bacterium]
MLSGCGGSDDSSSSDDPQAVLDAALGSSGDPIESGVLDLTFGLQSQDGGGVSADASLKGPFQSNGDGSLPSIDFDVVAGAETGGPKISIDGGVTLTPDGLFVSYGGSDYQVDDATFALLKDSYVKSAELQSQQQDSGSLSQFGIDPSTWLTDVTDQGTEDLDGTQVVHVSGTADVAKIVADLGTVAEQSGGAGQVDPASLSQLESSVDNATIDVYADAGDNTLRKLDITLDIADPTGSAGTESVNLSVGIADPNSDQQITAPTGAKPLSDLLSQFPGLASSLGGVASGTGVAPSAAAPSTGTGATGGGGSDAYYACVAAAPTPAEVTKCAQLLGG